MAALYILAFLLIAAAILSLLDITPADILHDLFELRHVLRPDRKLSMKQQIKRTVRKKQIRGIRKIITEAISVLRITHRTDQMHWYITATIFLFFAGILIPSLFGNYFLMPVLAIGLALLPWLSILLSAATFQKQLNEELETTLSTITTSYLQNDNILKAIRENIGNIHYPILEIFQKFLVQADTISSDISKLLEEMKNSLDNPTYQEWVNQIILCQQDRTLKSTLHPIVSKLSTLREVSGKLDNQMYEPVKEFITMAILVVLNFPMIRLMYPEWYGYLTQRTSGQILVAVVFGIVFFSLCACITKTRPVEFRR